MFVPKGPSATAVVNNPGLIEDLSSLDRDGLVARVATSLGITGSISFGSVTLTVFGGVEYFRVPAAATGISVSTSAPSGQVSVVLGEDA